MALIQSTAIPSGATDYELEQSLKFDRASSSYLSRTPSSTGNRRTFTFSTWLKRGNYDTAGSQHSLFYATGYDEINFYKMEITNTRLIKK